VLAHAIGRRDRKRLGLEQAQTGVAHAEGYVSEAYEQQEQAIAAIEAAQRAVDLKLEALEQRLQVAGGEDLARGERHL